MIGNKFDKPDCSPAIGVGWGKIHSLHPKFDLSCLGGYAKSKSRSPELWSKCLDSNTLSNDQ